MAEDVEFTNWLKTLEDKADDTLKPQLQAVMASELRNSFKSGFMAQKDYTQKTMELANKKAELEGTVDKLKSWYAVEGPKNEVLSSKLKEAEAKLAKVNEKLKAEFFDEGAPASDVNKTSTPDPTKYVAREEVEKLATTLKQFDQNSLRFNLDLATVQRRMTKENFDLDPQDVYAFAAKNKVTLVDAYEAMTQEDRGKRAEEAREKELKAAEERGFKSALSKHNLPDSPGRDYATNLNSTMREGLTDPNKRREAALKVFMDDK